MSEELGGKYVGLYHFADPVQEVELLGLRKLLRLRKCLL